MEKENFIQLTNNLYKLTSLFPKKEPLRFKIRELSNEILGDFLGVRPGSDPIGEALNRNLEALDSFFEVAKNQNWVSPEEILNLQEEYRKIKDELEQAPFGARPRPEPEAKDSSRTVLRSRQATILEILKERGRIQVWELKKIFPEVSKRTLRRDFASLLAQGLIERQGERNQTFYVSKR
jgi:hypothetical protein